MVISITIINQVLLVQRQCTCLGRCSLWSECFGSGIRTTLHAKKTALWCHACMPRRQYSGVTPAHHAWLIEVCLCMALCVYSASPQKTKNNMTPAGYRDWLTQEPHRQQLRQQLQRDHQPYAMKRTIKPKQACQTYGMKRTLPYPGAPSSTGASAASAGP
jgi:hypothetical protein